MAGANNEFVGENNHPNPPNHQNQSDGVETSVTPEVEDSRAASRISRSVRRQRSPTPENNRSRSRSRSPRPAPRRIAEKPPSPPRNNPRRKNHSPPQRNNHNSPPRNKRSPPRRNDRSPLKNGQAAARGGNARHSPRRESSGSGDERHRGPLSRRIMDIPLPRGLEKPPTLDKYDGTTDPDEHVQSVETALDYRNLRGSIKCKLFPLSLVRGASTWAHFTTSRRHPKTVASLKAIVQGPEESLRSYIERFNKVSVEVEVTDKMKLYLLKEGLREGTKFQEAVGIVEVQTLDAFFELAQQYIKWEDKQKASPRSEGHALSRSVDLPRREKNAEEMKRKGKVEKSEKLNHQKVATINGDIEAARRCFEAASKNLNSVVTPKKKKEGMKPPGVNSISTEDGVELDARTSKKERKQEKKAIKNDLLIKENYRPIPDGEFELVPLGKDPTKGVKIGADLPDLVKRRLKACLKENVELFAWSAAEMPGIDPEVACHQLTIDPRASAIFQRRRKQSPEKAEAARKAVKYLLEANFIAEAQYTTWLSNVVLVKKSNGKWRATYQRMMNKVFHNEIGDMLEVYIDDMIVKSEEEIDHTLHLKRVFDQARKFNMRFNPEKCTFGVKAGKFLGFYLTERGIEANPNKCRAFFDYPTPKSKKSIQTLDGMLTSMARFVAKSAQHALPLFKLLRKEKTFEWTEEALPGPELRYLQIEKIALPVIMAARKLRYYFLAHSIVVRTDQPVKQLLARPDMVGRMLKWSLELAEFDISFESRKDLKAQVLADFVAEMTTSTTSEKNKWTIFVDGSSNSQGSGEDIILENGDGVLIEVSLGLSFPTTNNQAEYEAFLAGLRLAEDMGAEEIKIFTDSQLVASQVSGEYQTKEERLLEYLNLIKIKLAKFKETEVKHVPRQHNARADVLSKLASTRRKKEGNQSLIQETLTKPSIEKAVEVIHICAIDGGFSIPLLKCVEETRVEFILQEIHEGINGQHIGGRSLARKALRAGYYWPTMQNDAKDHVLKCDKCQRHGDMHIAPANELKSLISPWPFAWWGMDILGPFPTAVRQVKYHIVAVDYFTKWIEAEPLAKIGASHVLRFFKRNVLARFGIPQVVVTDNGTQFTNKKFQEFLATIGTTQHFTSVEHPQTNGQAEAANRLDLSSDADVRAQRENTPCEPHRCLVHARQNAQLAMGCSMLRGKFSNEETFLDSSLGASQTLAQFHKLLGNGAYDPRHQEATVIFRRALAQRVIYLANRTSKILS
ncbi:hypothetical protein TSUD_284770 [Trifolium subterraneum]|uniref:Uncharacterized protein n=1 Tax=Trifolium subterraneum TaxID=3900 RepID=A0A2Z6PK59_TRISU|nr:hypothetical protein TSUD_284770 [Trifolium subterraneum]